ncbi:putative F-box/LRR-repeat protein At5g02930 [Vicia villosa]|uniref:putative F-box/LRR-repeat protein At5g02930 n=1 Tax=Vicia villosa TaxID=3911 RepID=UPI00273AA4CB|nr:putative F-box/LRR-repeat protein At5g02930 [Vicia villosa]
MKTRRRNYDSDGKDRLSDLPDCLLLEILSNLNVKQAVQMSILSPRWKNLWKHMSVVSLNYRFSFETLESITNFVSQFLSLRDDKTDTQTLIFYCPVYIESHLLERILKYAFSHHVQQLDMSVACNIRQFPLCNFSYHTLTSLKLTSCNKLDGSPRPLFPNSLILPALTHLSIGLFAFHRSCTTSEDHNDVEPFSVFKSLNTLIIQLCNVRNPLEDTLFISSVSLANLTIAMPSNAYKFKLCTPNLFSFEFLGKPLQNLRGRNCNNSCSFSSFKHAKIRLPFGTVLANCPFPPILFNWLVELALMESLTVSSKTLQILNLIPDSWKIDFPYLHNLKLLKIETDGLSVPNGIVDFLLQNSPSAKKVIKY